MHVTACFPGKRPRTLIAQDERARRYLRSIVAHDRSSDQARSENSGRIVLGGPGHSGCVEYAVAIGDAVDGSRRGLALRARNAIVLSPHLFLWYPSAGDSDLEVRFELPAGIQVSAPWRRTCGTKRAPIYRTGSRPASWDARIAIGTFRRSIMGAD